MNVNGAIFVLLAKRVIMLIEATVKYGKGKARFNIRWNRPGVYSAHLVSFEGSNDKSIPRDITLIRGIRYWAGSSDDQTLLNDLGKVIEHFFEPKEKNNKNLP